MINLTKKNASWGWEGEQEASFKIVAHFLISLPMFSQGDPTKPHFVRTDINYALGAAFLQGTSAQYPQHRLLTKSDQETPVATDHQPIRWLMNL